MTRDKKIAYVLSVFSAVMLLCALLFAGSVGRYAGAAAATLAAALSVLLLKGRSIPSAGRRQVLLLTSVSACLYIVLHCLLGLHTGFYTSPYSMSVNTLVKYVVPIAVTVIASEILRYRLLSQRVVGIEWLCGAVCVLSDVLLRLGSIRMASVNDFMELFGMTLIPSVTANLTFNYVCRRFGALPSMVYRLIMSLYVYFIPIVPATSDSLTALALMLLPLALYTFIKALFGGRGEKKKKSSRSSRVAVALAAVATVGLFALISCQFKYGMLIIGSESMSGELNMGDAAIYEQYGGEPLTVGEVIVFERGSTLVIHRVVEIEENGGELRYYTKGDFNEVQDAGYVTDGDIVGRVCLRLPCVGYPSVLLRKIFS